MMVRRKLSSVFMILVVVLALGVGTGLSTRAEEPQATARGRLADANELWHEKADYNAALTAFNEAVDLDPEDFEIRMRRGGFLEVVSHIVVEKEKQKFEQLARNDYAFVAQADPDGMAGGVARDCLGRLAGRELFPERTVECSEEAVQAYGQAESLFVKKRFEESLEFFEAATSACPESAKILVSEADAFFNMGEYGVAREIFLKALSVDPWHRRAHRYLCDTENRLGHNEPALRQAALAVVSDPTYEAAWSSLRSVARVLDRGWNRVYGEKTQVAITEGDAADQRTIQVTVPTAKKDLSNTGKKEGIPQTGASGELEELPDPDDVLWMAYALAKVGIVMGTIDEDGDADQVVSRELEPGSMSPFESDEQAVSSTLITMHEVAAGDSNEPVLPPGPFWSMIDRAGESGFLKEAIFLHMMDESLVSEYLLFRDQNAERLVTYLETLITPVAEEEGVGKAQ